MVYRVYVEKKQGFDNEARALAAELRNLLGIEALEGDLTTCLDGESMHSQCVTLKLADKKVNFFAPKGCDPDATAR